ncbi:MAG: CRP-like cAMP-binding protein [Flavobacteriaceae bacterium]|jgi:CRP-like cAMP-binding protein
MFKGADLERLASNRSCNQIKKGQSLFIEGGIPRGVFCLNAGKVKIYTRGEEGKEQIIRIATKGEIVGFRAMFSGDPYIVSAETLEESNVCFISNEDFTELIDTNVELRNGILKELSQELAERASFVTAMAQKSVRERLASVLLMLDKLYVDEMINLSREDLANYVGTATETLIRLLKDFKDEGLIKTHVRKIEILDKETISKIAGL